MLIRILSISVILCAVIMMTECDRGYCKTCRFIPYKRIKRGKYSGGPPKRFYSRPPVSFPHIGAFSYTPPPNFMTEDDQPYRGPPTSYKVSKRPSNDGLRDEDITNLIKHLTKQDLDKIIEFANEKQRQERPYPNSLVMFNNQYNKNPKKREEIDVYQANNDDIAAFDKFEKEIASQSKVKYAYTDNINPDSKGQNGLPVPYVDNKPYSNYATQEAANNVLQASNTIKEYDIQENIFQKQQEYLGDNQNVNQINNVVGERINDEYLPKPSNLRQDDYVISYTNNVPKVAKPEDSTYKVEDFGNLPLMNYHSKLDTVSSYHVPHYTITTPTKSQASALSSSSSAKTPLIEPAPPISAAKEQSDAHLKAVKIWSHRSKGTAYYLHSDGTLSLELPTRSKGTYGYF